MFNDEDEPEFISDKFSDCSECKNKFCELTCFDCDNGEYFEEEDMEEVDFNFQGRF